MSWETKLIMRCDLQEHKRRPERHRRHGACSDDPVHRKWAEVRFGVQRWQIQYAAVRMELIREWKRTERLLQHQRKQNTTASSPARERGVGGGGGDSRKVRKGEPASEGGEVTLSLKGRAFSEGGIRAHRQDAISARVHPDNFPLPQWKSQLETRTRWISDLASWSTGTTALTNVKIRLLPFLWVWPALGETESAAAWRQTPRCHSGVCSLPTVVKPTLSYGSLEMPWGV